MNDIEKRTQVERLTIAESLLASLWEEFQKGSIEPGVTQLAVNCQVDINRIVWKLNAQMEART